MVHVIQFSDNILVSLSIIMEFRCIFIKAFKVHICIIQHCRRFDIFWEFLT